jgi:Yip1 domain
MSEVIVTDTPGLTQIERVVDTFVAPSKTFTDILRSTTWWLPFLLAVVVTLGVGVAIDKQVGFERVVENVIHQSPKQEDQLSGLTAEARSAQIEKMAIGYRYTTYAFPVLILLFSAIGAAVLMGSFNFGLGARTTFGQMFCLWMYCSLPKLLSGLLTAVVLFFGGSAESFDLKNPVGTNLAYYLPDASPGLKAGLAFFDVIGLWTVVLLVLGSAIVAGVSKGKAAAVIVGWWVILLVVSVGTAAAFS